VRTASESTLFWRHPALPGAEFSIACLATHRFPPHAHDALAIGVVEQGIGRMTCRGGTHLAPRGGVLLIPRGEGHTGDSFGGGPLRYRMIYFPRALLERLGFREQTLRAVALLDAAVAGAVRRAQAAARAGADRLEVESTAVALLDLVFSRYAIGAIERDIRGDEPRLRAVRTHIATHAAEGLSLSALSALAGCSPEHLVRSFRRAYGLAPHQWHLSVRIERARALLARGRTLAEVAVASGFADASHLVRQFRRRVGETPAGYRRQADVGPSRPS
jgi:AraC-like DNA-binding protein/mannose-6-phosphate isomerase-like protein (cupin superfamily)